jgi:uncharacterized protein YbjT (DUF2867 family)
MRQVRSGVAHARLRTNSNTEKESSMSRVLVYQANSIQGGATVSRVQQAGYLTRALIRDRSKAADLVDRGIETAIADLNDLEALRRAHDSVDYVILQVPAYSDAFAAAVMDNAVAAMERACIKGVIVKLANPTPMVPASDSGFSANAIVLRALRRSGIPYAVVEPTMYLDTFLKPTLRHEIAQLRLIELPIAETLHVAWTTVDDAARLAAHLLKREAFGFTVRCAGEVAHNGRELAALFSTVLGRTITYRSVEVEAFRRDIESAIGAAAAAPVISKFGFLARHPQEAARMLGFTFDSRSVPGDFRPTPITDWIRAHRALFKN